ncbi:MAG: FHA domain-containing protein [Hyphomicrobiaceae bacterium]
MKPPSSRDVQTDAHIPNRRETASEQTVIIGDSGGGAQNSVTGAAAHPTPTPAPAPAAAPPPREPAKPVAPAPAMVDNGHTRLLPHPGMAAGSDMNKGSPVVGWLVVVQGPGKGSFRPVFPGSNTIGRSTNQRIPIDFGDDSISAEKQAFLVYDGRKRQFQLVPNLEKSNLVHLNDGAVLANTEIKAKDRLTIGQTTLLFVPLCGDDFDWAEMK